MYTSVSNGSNESLNSYLSNDEDVRFGDTLKELDIEIRTNAVEVVLEIREERRNPVSV